MKNDKSWKEEYLKRLKKFSVEILHFADTLRTNKTLVPVADQLVRSGTSVGANVHEAQGSGSSKDFAHFLQIALKSGRETVYWLEVLEEYKGEPSIKITNLKNECLEILNILYSSLKTLRKK